MRIILIPLFVKQIAQRGLHHSAATKEIRRSTRVTRRQSQEMMKLTGDRYESTGVVSTDPLQAPFSSA